MKICNKCKVEKEDAEFSKDPQCKRGIRGQCRDCDRASRRARQSKAKIAPDAKICTKCGIEKPSSAFFKLSVSADGLNSNCKACLKLYTAGRKDKYDAWRKDNRARLVAQDNERNKNPIRKKYKCDRERERRLANPELHSQKQRESYQRNKEKRRAEKKQFRIEHPDIIRNRNRRRKAVLRGAKTEAYRDVDIFERDKWVCGICSLLIDKNLKHPDNMSRSIDHIVPISKGGMDCPDNVQAAHLVCNIKKRDKYEHQAIGE